MTGPTGICTGCPVPEIPTATNMLLKKVPSTNTKLKPVKAIPGGIKSKVSRAK